MSEVNMEMGRTIYNSICSVLDKMNIKYNKIEDKLVIVFGYKGQDMNHDLLIAVNANQEAIQLIERLPYSIDPEKAADVAMAICYVNNRLLSGKFTYDMKETLSFEMTQLYSGSLIGEATLQRMLLALIHTVEEFDDKFMALNKGYLKAEDFKEN